MKRKVKQVNTSRKKPKLSSEEPAPKNDFLSGIKCYIHPANFGTVRLNIFQRLVRNNGAELYDTLPQSCDGLTHVIFEESIDAEKIKKLIDSSKYANVAFVRCSWLSACSKSKTKVDTKEFEIELAPPKPKKNILVSKEEPKAIDTLSSATQNTSFSSEKQDFKSTQIASTSQSTEHFKKLVSNNNKVFTETAEPVPGSSKWDVDFTQTNESKEGEADNKGNVSEDGLKRKSSNMSRRYFPDKLKEKFACARPSSSEVKDLNRHITAELEKLAAAYKSKNDTWRALGYQKAISAIRNHPKAITSRQEALSIRGVGGRLADKVAEIVESGKLRKVAEVCEDEEAKTLQLFMGVWGAGPTTARNWFVQGYRTLQDLQEKATLTKHQQIGLKFYEDINSRIPRAEVVEIEDYVRSTALSIKEGLIVMVCGSYRRGKPTCGDVDVLLTHPDGQSHENIFQPLLKKLRETGFLTDDLVTQEDNGDQKKYLGVCRLPGEDRKHRRLDIIVVPYNEFAPALMYFTGSAHFNRSMRLLAIKMGMSLSEHGLRTGIIRQKGEKLTQGCLLNTPTEESIFKHLGLEYRSPKERDH